MRATVLVLALFGLATAGIFNGTATLPQSDAKPKERAASVAAQFQGFIYGPSLIGQASFFPNGTLGNARVNDDMALWQLDRTQIKKAMGADVAAATKAIQTVNFRSEMLLNDNTILTSCQNGGLKSLDDYARVLYNNEWTNSNPRGEAPGIMTNYTQDLLFSMERLSQNPYPLHFVKSGEALPFTLADDLAIKIAGVTLKQLQSAGKLYVVDRKCTHSSRYNVVDPHD